MPVEYPIFHVQIEGTIRERRGRIRSAETMGTKEKFWLLTRAGRRVLLKYAREDTGEDWSEKLAYEVAKKLHIPCPRVDLAETDRGRGVLCWDFLASTRHPPGERSLIHGNELLLRRDSGYPSGRRYGVAKHTISAIRRALSKCLPPDSLSDDATHCRDAFDVFVGYLLLDALIGNTDRHHENWAVVSQRGADKRHRLELAPSYDHASSLGRELDDVKRRGRLDSSGRGTLAEYAAKARSAIWDDDGNKLTPLGALALAADHRPAALRGWQTLLKATTIELIWSEVDRVPRARLTDIGKKFTKALLTHNYHEVLALSA